MDKIIIKDLVARGIIGVNDWERENKQEIRINRVLYTDITKAGEKDLLDYSVNYRTVAKKALAHAESAARLTVEALATDLARICLAEKGVEKVMVRVENNDLLLKPGMTANAEILVGERQNVLRLPAKALYFKAPEELMKMSARSNGRSGQGQGGGRRREERTATDTIPVWLMSKGGAMEVKTVKIGFSNQDYIELPGDELKEGDQVIIGIRGEAAAGNNSRRGSVRMRL